MITYEIPNKRGEKLAGIFEENPRTKNLVILCHGSRGSKNNNLLSSLSKSISKISNTFRFDFSGNGDSEGRLEESTYSKDIEDLDSIIDSFIKKGYKIKSIIGHSKGGSDLILNSKNLYEKTESLILLAPRINLFNASEMVFLEKNKNEFEKNEFYLFPSKANHKITKEYINDLKSWGNAQNHYNLKIPTLILHGIEDKVVPIKESEEFSKKFPGTRFIKILGANHSFKNKLSPLGRTILRYLKKIEYLRKEEIYSSKLFDFYHLEKIKDILNVYRPKNFLYSKKIQINSKEKLVLISSPFNIKNKKFVISKKLDERKILLLEKEKSGPKWSISQELNLPFLSNFSFSKINDDFIFSGINEKTKKIEIYRSSDIKNFELTNSFSGNINKIDFLDLDGKLAVFITAKSPTKNFLSIYFTTVESLRDLNSKNIKKSVKIKTQFSKKEFGGLNQIIKLGNNKFGILGNVFKISEKGEKFSYPIVFCFDPLENEVSSIRIILRRSELPDSKSSNLQYFNWVFPRGIIRENKTSKLYVNTNLDENYEVIIKDPFKYYEDNF